MHVPELLTANCLKCDAQPEVVTAVKHGLLCAQVFMRANKQDVRARIEGLAKCVVKAARALFAPQPGPQPLLPCLHPSPLLHPPAPTLPAPCAPPAAPMRVVS